tara:strand:- start:238 stop:756 length:519 start_codon:yes stop_codon:yes gene_type:complete
MKKNLKLTLITLGALFVAVLYVKSTRKYDNPIEINKPSYDFSSVEGIMSFLDGKSYSEGCSYSSGISTISFNSNGTCMIKVLDKRTEQIKYSHNGKYQVGFSKYTDTGVSYKYIRIDWEYAYSPLPMCYSFFGESGIIQIKNFGGFDSYGPLAKSFYSQGGLVNDCYKFKIN